MSRSLFVFGLGVWFALPVPLAPSPLPLLAAQEPPRLLPTSITGKPAPITRFQAGKFPPHTLAGLHAARAGAEWLTRQSLPNGRLAAGFDPRTGRPPDADHELRQATAALALAEAAAFTGDDRLGAVAAQTVLTLLTQTREAGGVRTPTLPADKCNPVAFAATLLLAVEALPDDAPRRQAADGLAAYLRTQVRPDGGVGCGGDPAAVDREGLTETPGLVLRALVAVRKRNPADPTPLSPIIACYQTALHTRFVPAAAAALLPGAADLAVLDPKPAHMAAVFALADRLCAEPPTAASAEGLAAACTVCRRAGDVGRFDRYRQAAVFALGHARSLQYTTRSTAGLPPAAAHRLVGAVALAPADPTARPDRAAGLVLAHLRFLASGAEGE